MENFKDPGPFEGLRLSGFENVNIPNLKRVVTWKKYFVRGGKNQDMKQKIGHEEIMKK
jgi:hypothetical protein